jgi:hypothetical protein
MRVIRTSGSEGGAAALSRPLLPRRHRLPRSLGLSRQAFSLALELKRRAVDERSAHHDRPRSDRRHAAGQMPQFERQRERLLS